MKHITRLHLFFWLSLLGLALSPLTFATSYKWTDSKGNVHYSQQPPRGKSYEKIKTPRHRPASTPHAKSAPTAASSSRAASTSSSKAGNEALKKEQASNAELRKQNCQQSKKILQAYSVYSRIRDPDGTVRYISEKERAAKKKQAEEGIREFCN